MATSANQNGWFAHDVNVLPRPRLSTKICERGWSLADTSHHSNVEPCRLPNRDVDLYRVDTTQVPRPNSSETVSNAKKKGSQRPAGPSTPKYQHPQLGKQESALANLVGSPTMIGTPPRDLIGR